MRFSLVDAPPHHLTDTTSSHMRTLVSLSSFLRPDDGRGGSLSPFPSPPPFACLSRRRHRSGEIRQSGGDRGREAKAFGEKGKGTAAAEETRRGFPPSLHRFTRGQNIFTVKEGGESGDRTKRPPPLHSPFPFGSLPACFPSTLFSSCLPPLPPSSSSLGWFGCFAATKRRREGRGRPRGRN